LTVIQFVWLTKVISPVCMYVCMYVCGWVGMQHSLLLLPTVMDTGRGSRSSICYCRRSAFWVQH